MNTEMLTAYWSDRELAINFIILLHLLGALAVGILLGYERSYHGRAAGLRTYALVCMASTALTVIIAYPSLWYGGLAPTSGGLPADPTRVIQGLMTGIGFLGAGVIMREGFSIRGLSTAASIWMTAAIGILIGVGFYAAAIIAALFSIAVMSGFHWVEIVLPHRSHVHLSLSYARAKRPDEAAILALVGPHGYEVGDWAFHLNQNGQRFEYQLVLTCRGPGRAAALARALAEEPDLIEFQLTPTRT
ncbi:MAG: MgtC/SapB family protein [Rhodospirillales bacterium]|nr:MgtC/SapB family protein [Rhodospirillales bacterium]